MVKEKISDIEKRMSTIAGYIISEYISGEVLESEAIQTIIELQKEFQKALLILEKTKLNLRKIITNEDIDIDIQDKPGEVMK